MSIMNRLNGLQQLGRALMLPIAVLPVAGLLLRLGQPDLLNIKVMAQAGDAIFGNLALIFAIGVAVGFAKENNGTAGLAGAIGFLVLTAVLKAMPDTLLQYEAFKSFVQMDEKGQPVVLNMGVLAGIIAGISAGMLYNKYKDFKLPPYLAFFSGKRFVPIVTGFSMLFVGVVAGFVWPWIQLGIDHVGHWLIGAGGVGLFIYGVLNRLLLVTGLHHILNSFIWFVFGNYTDVAGKVATGDLNRFFAGDPTAGAFMAGFFPIMMFGLPAACYAMYRCAKPENRPVVGGVLLSMGLTSFLTGVTEPVEFAFMFLAPVLYAIHAVLTGISLAVMHALDVRLGFTFSAGLFDYVLSGNKGQNPLLLLPVGAVYALVYYGLFTFFIKKFNLMTIGREDKTESQTQTSAASNSSRGEAFVAALGGAGNLKAVDACTTRLRLTVVNNATIDEAALKTLGSRGLIKLSDTNIQVVIGPEVDIISDEIRAALGAGQAGEGQQTQASDDYSMTKTILNHLDWSRALGGDDNVHSIKLVAGGRLRVALRDSARINQTALKGLGVQGIMKVSDTVVQLLVDKKRLPR
ncbi:N-acetylglucosamine-specific PTS transporter subunit IIBC [Hydromonas duriensis]|uniref:PTS system N-acetylglucosamine-specific IIB component (Glc family) /PTS system N-acetylglucosamine-specific IIC component (Glc family) n=1 Tax=Hydromonas duriensis TaxID=1527608 RepID=A0A4R6YA53_9BURK|nr:PTS system N-acetylglucosamine-specific IIB component (Glc family) /PTS system N-acetylglucosamine-specific IIC component (Glc family) [Hydromonas duriensis]